MSGRPGWIRAMAAVLLSLAAVGALPTAVQAATPSVTAPTAKVVFLTAITFTGSATLSTDVARVEIVIDVEGNPRSIVAEVPTSVTSGPVTLSWVLATPGGFLLPNTNVTARFRLDLRSGATVLGTPITVHYDDTRFAWKTATGVFVTVHWVDGDQAFGRKALKIADDAVKAVSTLLGVTETAPIDFYVYGDRTAFYDVLGPGTRENVGGEAHPDIRTLFANIAPSGVNDPWVGIVIPHELTHLVFDTAVKNAYHYPPRWLNEGIAVYLSQGYDSADRATVTSAVQSHTLMPVEALAGQFPTTQDRFYLAYAESVSAVSFLVDRYGRDAMVKLVQSYRAGVSDDEAFQSSLGVSVAGFEAAWLGEIGAPVPSPYGPQPDPAGPVPPGWAGSGPIPGTAQVSPSPAATAAGAAGGSSSGSGRGVLLWALISVFAAGVGLILLALRRSHRTAAVNSSNGAGALTSGPSGLAMIRPVDPPPATPTGPWAAPASVEPTDMQDATTAATDATGDRASGA